MGLFDKIKHILKPNQNLTNTLPKPNLEHTKTLPKANQKLILDSAFKTSEFPLRVFVIIGKQGVGKTTLAKNLSQYYKDNGIKVVNVEKLEDLEVSEAVLVIDDLKRDLTKTIMNRIVESFRVVRHKKQIIILTHHILNDIPSDLLKLSDKVIMFNTSFNPNQPFSKINLIISKSKKEALHELVLSLEPYQYIIIKSNKIFGKFSNMDVEPIIGDTKGSEIALINGKSKNNNILEVSAINNRLLDEIYNRIPEFDYLTVSQKIISLKKEFPRLKPKVITAIVGTTPSNTWKTLSVARKKGLIP